MSLLTFWAQGDFVIRFVAIALLVLSVSTWVIILWKFSLLRRVKADVSQCTAAFWQAAQFEEAHSRVAQFDRDRTVLPMLEASLLPLGGTLAAAGERHHQLTRVLREAMQSVLRRLQWGQVLLATAGSTSPFIGLLGTVWGVMEAFSAVATQQSAGIQQLAPGVSGAMLATIAGLVVAIPSVFGYNFLLGNTRTMTIEIENYASSLADRLELESK